MKAKKFPEHTHKSSMEKAEIVIYKSFDDTDFQIEVRVEDETVWLNRQQLAILFN